MLEKLQVKQPGNEKEEDFMSRHLDAVVTSTLIQKKSRHQRTRKEKSRQHQLKKRGRDIRKIIGNLMQVATGITR